MTNWLNTLHSDELLAVCISCTKNSLPSISAHYDFISRLWLSNLASDRGRLKKTYSFKKKPSKIKAFSKNKKLPNKHSGIVKKIVDFFREGRSF